MLNWLVVGIGDITTRRVIPAILEEPRSRLYGVVSRDPAKGRRYAEKVWTGLDDALLDPAIDAVYVATPVALHAPQTIASLEAGKHALCEKPMAMNHAEASRMVEASARTGKTLGIAYYRRMYPKLHMAKALIGEGAIGRPVLAELICHDWFDNEDGRRGWFLGPEMAGGGPLYDTASHRIDVLNFLFGRPVAVSAHLSHLVHKRRVEDAATLLIDYENGARGIIDVRRHSKVDRDECRIIGVKGEIQLSPLNGPALASPRGPMDLPPHANLHYPCIENFVSAVLDRAHLYSSGESAIWTDWVTEQAMRGAKVWT